MQQQYIKMQQRCDIRKIILGGKHVHQPGNTDKLSLLHHDRGSSLVWNIKMRYSSKRYHRSHGCSILNSVTHSKRHFVFLLYVIMQIFMLIKSGKISDECSQTNIIRYLSDTQAMTSWHCCISLGNKS